MSKESALSLEEFIVEKKRQECAVCQLPDEIRAQLEGASDKKIKRTVQLEWLKSLGYDEVDNHALNKHYSGRHKRVDNE